MHNPVHAVRVSAALLALMLPVAPSLAQEPAAPAAACPATADGSDGCVCMHAMHSGEMPDGPDGMRMFERMGTELALTDTQKQELGALLEIYRPRIQELAKRVKTSGQALVDVAPDDPSYNTRAAELSERAGATASEMVTLLAELQASAYALLTPEQQARYLQLRSERRARLEEMRARMQERRQSGDWQPGVHKHRGKCMHDCMTSTAPVTEPPAAGAE